MVKASLLLFLTVSVLCADGMCGDDLCIDQVGDSSYCSRNTFTCHGAPEVSCLCTVSDRKAYSVKRSMKHKRRRSPRKVATRRLRRNMKFESKPENPTDIFMWLEWPSLRSYEWTQFYENLLSFMDSNCGNFRVTRVIARVLSPVFQQDKGKLWQVGTDSVFYTSFLSQVASGTEIFIYPYLLGGSPGRWIKAMGTSTALEAVYKYVSEWNKLLATVRPDLRISGIVTDFEERKGFKDELPMIGEYREKYSSRGEPLLRFGAAFGYDQPKRARRVSGFIDDTYLELYDLYERGYSSRAPRFQQGRPGYRDKVLKTLEKMDADVWGSLVEKYDEPNVHFMWSLQSRSSSDCLYSRRGRCGAKDDFGSWSAPKVAEFIRTVQERYPSMSHQAHGFFQFNYTPQSWMTC
jgi:hypothetical protein